MITTFEVDQESTLNKGFKKDFDLIVFEKNDDYLCYVEAIYALYHEKELLECPFMSLENVDFFPAVGNKKRFTDYRFLKKGVRTKEYFFVIDNTDWSDALNNKDHW